MLLVREERGRARLAGTATGAAGRREREGARRQETEDKGRGGAHAHAFFGADSAILRAVASYLSMLSAISLAISGSSGVSTFGVCTRTNEQQKCEGKRRHVGERADTPQCGEFEKCGAATLADACTLHEHAPP